MTMEYGTILLVVGNPDDELLTRRTLRKNDICNDVVVALDRAEVLDYLFAGGQYEWRDLGVMPQLLLLDLKLPKVDGLEAKKGPPNGFRLGHNPLL